MARTGVGQLPLLAAIATAALLGHASAFAKGHDKGPPVTAQNVAQDRAPLRQRPPSVWAWRAAAKATHPLAGLHDVIPYGMTRPKEGEIPRHVFRAVGGNTIITVSDLIPLSGKPAVTRYRSRQRAWDIRPEWLPNRLQQLGLDLGPDPRPLTDPVQRPGRARRAPERGVR